MSVATDGSSLTVSAQARGTATITATAADGKGGTVSDAFDVTVKASPAVASALADVSGLEVDATQEVSLSGVFSDADGDALTITAASSDDATATVTVVPDQSKLTLEGVSEGTATITVTAQDSDGNQVSDTFDAPVARKYTSLIVRMYDWRNNSEWSSYKEHTDRWDRALKAFGETVADNTLTAMTAEEAQEFADRGWTPWVEVAAALRELENQAPTVSSAIADATIVNESSTSQVSLSGVFSDADNDSLTITAASSDETKATVSVASDYSSLTVMAQARGTATVTVTADDGNGGTVQDTFSVTVKAAPVVAAARAGGRVAVGHFRSVYLVGLFSDADGDALTISASSGDETVATVTTADDGSILYVVGVEAGEATITVVAQDSDGNRVSHDLGFTVTSDYPTKQVPPPLPPIIDQVVAVHEGYYIYWPMRSVEDLTKYSIRQYEIAWKKQTDTEWESGTMPAFEMKNLKGLEIDQKYHIRIRGTNVKGETSDWSEVYDAPKVESRPDIPNPPGLLWLVPYEDSILVKILPPLHTGGRTITHYILRYTDDGGATFSDRILTPDETPDYKITGLRPGTEYGVVARTANSVGSSKDSHLFVTETSAQQQQDPDNNAPTVSDAIADVTIVNESGTHQVSLSGVFSDADNDSLTVTAASSGETVATVSVALDQSSLTVNAQARGQATITVTANDGNGGTVDDTFDRYGQGRAGGGLGPGRRKRPGGGRHAGRVPVRGVQRRRRRRPDHHRRILGRNQGRRDRGVGRVQADAYRSCRGNNDHHGNGPGLRRQPGQRRLRRGGGPSSPAAAG